LTLVPSKLICWIDYFIFICYINYLTSKSVSSLLSPKSTSKISGFNLIYLAKKSRFLIPKFFNERVFESFFIIALVSVAARFIDVQSLFYSIFSESEGRSGSSSSTLFLNSEIFPSEALFRG